MTGPVSTGSDSPGHEWTEPGAYEVVPGVHRIPLPLPMDALRAINVYVVETATGLTLIDGGWAIPQSRAQFEDGLRQIGRSIRDIEQFLVTHMHRDHYTQAYVLGQELGVPVSLGMGERATLELMNAEDLRERGDPNVARLILAGAESAVPGWRAMLPDSPPSMDDYGMPSRWLQRDVSLDLGDRRLNALATPGHTQGHYVFADLPQSLLFAGDHVLPTITPSIGFEPAWVRQPLRDYLESLRKVRALPDLLLLPAHGPVAGSTHARIDELLEHHHERLDQCLDAVRGGAQTAWEVAGELPWTRRRRPRDDLGPFDVVMAAFETLAHLELLVLHDRARRSETDGVARFTI